MTSHGIPPAVTNLCPYFPDLHVGRAEVTAAQATTGDGHDGSVDTPLASNSRMVAGMEAQAQAPLSQASAVLPDVHTTAPAASLWSETGGEDTIQLILRHAGTVSTPERQGTFQDNKLVGRKAELFDANTAKEIREFQERQAKADGSPDMPRLIHRKQLFGGQAQIHWNPAMNSQLKLFGMDSQQAILRISDASSSADPNGKTMYGFAMELTGADGKPTDILLTGGTPQTEHSQAPSPQGQLDLFNMLHGNKLEGLARIVAHEGPVGGFRMLHDVSQMQTEIDSVANLTAWSRAPFSVTGKDGTKYLVKMRVVPMETATPTLVSNEKSGQRLADDMALRTQQGETRWRMDLQFALPKVDDVDDPRENWHGPWLAAAQIVIPQGHDAKLSHHAADIAENTKFSVWKNKEADSDARDQDVFTPFGEINRARLAAYKTSGDNRGCPYLSMMGQADRTGPDPTVR